MSHALADHAVTIAEFDAFTRLQPDDTRWELVDGHILAMTNPTARHGQIVANIGTPLKVTADRHGCRVNFGGIRVQSAPDGAGVDKTIPDLTVRCGAWSPEQTFITDPVIVVEVLSPSTMDFDRGAKLEFYKAIPSLQDIVLAYQDQVRLEHYRREGEGWTMQPLTKLSDALALTALDSPIALAEIYAETGVPG